MVLVPLLAAGAAWTLRKASPPRWPSSCPCASCPPRSTCSGAAWSSSPPCPILAGGLAGGLLGGRVFRRLNMTWLRRGFALLILYGGARGPVRFMTGWLLPLLAGTATGVLSAFGVGGGTLLLIYMTAFAGLPQDQAQGINLLYFLPRRRRPPSPPTPKTAIWSGGCSSPPSPPALPAPAWAPGPPPGWTARSCAGASEPSAGRRPAGTLPPGPVTAAVSTA